MQPLIVILFCLFGIWETNTPMSSSQQDPCNIYGRVYLVNQPYEAHYKVFVDDTEAFVDVLVFEEENGLYADEGGHWKFVDQKEFADVYIHLVEKRYLADFSIYFTEYAAFAGCHN